MNELLTNPLREERCFNRQDFKRWRGRRRETYIEWNYETRRRFHLRVNDRFEQQEQQVALRFQDQVNTRSSRQRIKFEVVFSSQYSRPPVDRLLRKGEKFKCFSRESQLSSWRSWDIYAFDFWLLLLIWFQAEKALYKTSVYPYFQCFFISCIVVHKLT